MKLIQEEIPYSYAVDEKLLENENCKSTTSDDTHLSKGKHMILLK